MNDISFLDELEYRLKMLEEDLDSVNIKISDSSPGKKRDQKHGIILDEINDSLPGMLKNNKKA